MEPYNRPGLADDIAQRAGVSVINGAQCGTAGKQFIRFNIALPRPLLEEGIRRIAQVAVQPE